MTPEDAAALMAEAGAIDAGQAQAAQAAQDPQSAQAAGGGGPVVAMQDDMRKAAEWFLIPKTLAWAITAVFPETAPAYTDEKCMELAQAIVPVAEKYGLSGIGDSPELTLLVGTGLFCLPGVMAYRARKAKADEEAEAARAGGAQPGASPSTHKPAAEMVRGQHGDR